MARRRPGDRATRAVGSLSSAAGLAGAMEAGRLLIGRIGLFIRGGTHIVGSRQLDYFVETGVRYLFRLEAS